MGLYLRKSIKVGPLRFNLSAAGIGVSGGVRGFRVGSGPRGNYVHMGAHGLYYRSVLGGGSHPRATVRVASQSPRGLQGPPSDALTEIESGSVEAMAHSSSAALLEEIRTKRKLFRHWPIALSLGGFFWLILAISLSLWVSLLTLVALLATTVWLARRDVLRKTVVLIYQFDSASEAAYQGLHNGFDWLANAKRAWHLEAKGAVSDWKKNAGATSLVRRQAILLPKQDPPDVKTNIAIPAIPVGRQRLYFLPDRLLVYEGRSVGAVGYDQLCLEVATSRFIETEIVPEDAEVVGSTWRYVNKNGGPDRRFKDNRQLPIVLYGQVHLTSPTGLNEVIQVSNAKAAEYFVAGVNSQAAALRPPASADVGAPTHSEAYGSVEVAAYGSPMISLSPSRTFANSAGLACASRRPIRSATRVRI